MPTPRDDQIEVVEQGFKDLAELARNSWSNIAITDKVKALHVEVKKLYAPVIVVREVPAPPPPPPPKPPRGKPMPRPDLPRDFEPVEVSENTRWG